MTYIYCVLATLGWFGILVIAPGLLDSGAPIWTGCAVGAGSLALAAWSGWRAGIMR